MCPGKYILNKRWLRSMALFLFYQDYIVVLSLMCFNWTENCLMYSWKNCHKCCHFEVIYHDVVIWGKWSSINWDNTLKCTRDQRLFKKGTLLETENRSITRYVKHINVRDGWRETDVSTRCQDPEEQMFWNTAPKRDSKNTHVTWLRRFEASGRVTSVSRRGIPADSAFDWQGRE